MILLNFCKGREFLSFFVEVLTKFDLGEARPDLSGALFAIAIAQSMNLLF